MCMSVDSLLGSQETIQVADHCNTMLPENLQNEEITSMSHNWHEKVAWKIEHRNKQIELL